METDVVATNDDLFEGNSNVRLISLNRPLEDHFEIILNVGRQHARHGSYEKRKQERDDWNRILCTQRSLLDKKKLDLLEVRVAIVRNVLLDATKHNVAIEEAIRLAASEVINQTAVDEKAEIDEENEYGE